MTILEARIRRRLFRPLYLQVFRGGELVFGEDEGVVKYRRTQAGVRIWALWSDHDGDEVVETWFPIIDELRVSR